MQGEDRSTNYQRNSLTLAGAGAMGTGAMIGAGIFALTGQIAEFAGPWFPLTIPGSKPNQPIDGHMQIMTPTA